MPGGRLTIEDRQQISAGLAGRLGYAEIARQMGRPTSTVSREVLRNGGPDGYRPEQAHRAAGQRARRRKVPPPPARPVDADGPGQRAAAVREFAEQFVTVMIQSGFPAMPARVLSNLIVCDSGSRTAGELVQLLRVSPASVSKAVRYLEQLGCIRRERGAGRRECYLISPDVWHDTWMHSARSQLIWVETAEKGVRVCGADTPAGIRLAEMTRFFRLVHDDLVRAAEQWWKVLAEERAARARSSTSPGSVRARR